MFVFGDQTLCTINLSWKFCQRVDRCQEAQPWKKDIMEKEYRYIFYVANILYENNDVSFSILFSTSMHHHFHISALL